MANLITLAEYKAYAGIASPNQDSEINAIIPKVSALAKSICRRTFVDYVNDAKVERFNGGFKTLLLKEYPVLAVSGVAVSYDYGATFTDLVEFTDYVLDPEEHSIVCISADEFPRLINGYQVTYTGGYESLPEDLKLAVFDLVTYYLRNEMSVRSNKTSGSNSLQIEYVNTTNLPAHIKRVFDLYTADYS